MCEVSDSASARQSHAVDSPLGMDGGVDGQKQPSDLYSTRKINNSSANHERCSDPKRDPVVCTGVLIANQRGDQESLQTVCTVGGGVKKEVRVRCHVALFLAIFILCA